MEPCSFSSELVFLTVISSFPHTRLYVSIKLHKHPHPPTHTHTHTHTHTNTHAYMCEKDLFCIIYIVHSLVTQSCPTLWDPMDCSLPSSSVHGIFPGKSTGMGCHFLLQGIVLTQGMNQGLPHCRQAQLILKQRDYPGGPNLMAEVFLTVLTISRKKHQIDLEVEKGSHTDTGLMMGEAK